MKERDVSRFVDFYQTGKTAPLTEENYQTAQEICQQPEVWKKTWATLASKQEELKMFLDKAYLNGDLEIILTGAGSSAFVGSILEGLFQKNTKRRCSAIPTTDLLSHPEHYFNKTASTLLVSFARSGNSPESLAAINLANSTCNKIYHLVITCCPNGRLAQMTDQNNNLVLLLPPETCDQGLAMTSSFTSMLLAGILLSRVDSISGLKNAVEQIAKYGEQIISGYSTKICEIAKLDFHRVVVLGSGPMQGVAREAHLKIQELTNGTVISKCDSFLGFRHGPKVVIDESTLVMYLFSNNDYVHHYEKDLVASVNQNQSTLYSLGVSESLDPVEIKLDLNIILSPDGKKIDEDFLLVCSVLPAQILGYYKSLQLGLNPDNPSRDGVITRVVQGVTIYPYAPATNPQHIIE